MALLGHGGGLDHGAAEIALQHAQPAGRLEGRRRLADDLRIGAVRRHLAPGERAVLGDAGIGDIAAQPGAPDGVHVLVQQPGIEQLADHEAHAAGGVELVHIRLAAGIDAAEQRRHFREIGEIVPAQGDSGGGGHGDEMDGVVGGAAGRVQPDHAVDEGALVQDAADRHERVAGGGDGQRPAHGLLRQRVAQRGAGVDEAGPRQVQAHDLHEHLVGVGGAVEGAGAGTVIGARFRLQQRLAPHLALGEELADPRLLVVRQAGGHRPGGDEDARQMSEGQRADHQPRHDLVADAEIDGGVEGLVRQRDGGGERDDVAREERELHSRLALRDAVAHGGHAARDLRRGPGGTRGLADQLGEALIGLVRREHVVIGGDDAEIGRVAAVKAVLVGRATGGKGMRLVGAAERLARRLRGSGLDPFQIAGARRAAALHDAFGDFADPGLQRHCSQSIGTLPAT